MAVLGDEEGVARVGGDVVEHRHRFRGGRRLVEQRGVGHRQRRQVLHHRLIVEQRFQTALRDLRLVRRVLRVPAGVLEDVALDDGRSDRVRVPHPDVAAEHLVLRGDPGQLAQQAEFGATGRQIERLLHPDGGWYGPVDQLVEVPHSERREHLLHVPAVGPDVAVDESIRVTGRLHLFGLPLGGAR